MREENTKKRVVESKNSKKIRKKVKKQISLFTIMLWVFLITTMVTITVNSTKKTNALEVEDENWNIGLVMYDRSSDTPNQAITECTWNAVNENETKQLCMQINYACTTNKGYQPGEIEIEINGFGKNGSERFKKYFPEVVIGADKISDSHKGYDFSYSFDEGKNLYTFTNNEAIAQNEHFEGTIQIVYNLLPKFRIKTDLEFKAKIKENIEDLGTIISKESNICNFHYTSIKITYDLENKGVAGAKKDYTKIEDILDNYYWVEYFYKPSKSSGVIVAYSENKFVLSSGKENVESIKTTLPDGCVMYDKDLNKIEAREENNYYLNENTYYYVGYPKNDFDEGDEIKNTAQLWGRYEDESSMQKLAEASSVIYLVNFDFEYTGNLYSINKVGSGVSYINALKNSGSDGALWDIGVTALYTDSIMDVEIGDDLLYITRENGEVTRLEDYEYNFTRIDIPVFYTYNKYSSSRGDALIGYKYELQARYKNTNEWRKIYEGTTTTGIDYRPQIQEQLTINTNDIVGLKVVIKNLDKALYQDSLKTYMNIYTQDCSIGKIYNFDYLQVYKKDEDGNSILVNEPNIDSYNTESTKLNVAEYDMNTYGTYMQRAYSTVDIKDGYLTLKVEKNRYNNIINNNVKKQYEVEYKLKNKLSLSCFEVNKDCIIKTYDILPIGMELESTKDEIIDSIKSDLSYENLKLKDGTIFNTEVELKNYIKENTTIDIDYNYKNSGRTKISIIYNLNQIDWSYYIDKHFTDQYISIDIVTRIPYDNILEYGTSYTNHIYTMWNNQEYSYSRSIKDNGEYDLLASDIDNDGYTEEKVAIDLTTLNITHAVSSKQSVIKQVRTDLTKGRFVEGTADATAGSEYTYKLRVTTGANSLKDLIIYDNIELILDNEGNDISSGWKGEFLGIDTTYAVSKGYAPVVYYSEEQNPGKLTEVPDKWKILTEDTDKFTVKSICVDLRYKVDGSEIELSANNVVFVLVNMQAPNDKTLTTSVNNMFSTNWRAKDSQSGTIDNVEGIYSNQVNVNIYKEENKKQEIAGEKIWKDNNNLSYRPKSIIIKLLQDGTEYRRDVVTKENNWKYKFKDVPVYKNELLEKYNYEIREEKVPYYEATYDGYDIINTLSGKDISVTKTWVDEYNHYNTRPESITVKLLQDGIEYMRKEVTEEENWSYIFEDVPIYKNDSGEEYVYTIEEVEVPGYGYKVEYDELNDKYKITNTLKTKNIEVTKIWDDDNNKHGLRPKYVMVELFDGENKIDYVFLSNYIDWKYTFENLPECRADGSKIEYTIDEKVFECIDGYFHGQYVYEENFENEGDFELYKNNYITQIVGNTITNKYVDPDERVKITGTKVWEDNNDIARKRPDSIVLQIKNGEKVVSEAVIDENTNWCFEFEVPKYDENGSEILYYIDEKETLKFYEKEIVDEYTVKNKFVVPDEKVKISVIKLWEDDENKYNKRQNNITLQVYDREKLVAESKVNEKNNWRYEFEVPKYDKIGNEIEYRVDEKEENKYYEKRISGYTVINKCIYEPVVDTSDINVFVYIIVFFIAIVGLIVGVIFVGKNRLNKK